MEAKPKICDHLRIHGLNVLKITLLLFTSFYFFSSCTVQKRKYRKGIYLHVNSKHVTTNPNLATTHEKPSLPKVESIKPSELKEVASAKSTFKTDSLIREYFKLPDKSTISVNPVAARSKIQSSIKNFKQLYKEVRLIEKQRNGTEPEKKLLVSALIGMILTIFALLAIPIGIVMLFTLNYTGIVLIFFSALLVPISLALNLTALFKKSKHPKSYSGETMAIIGLVFDILLLIIYLSFLKAIYYY